MVSLWPFKGDTTSTATFEKTLQTLSAKITKATTKDTALRGHLRRYKALWTLYTTFIYTIYTIILVLVTGYKRWGPPEYGAVVGGPVVVYTGRTILSLYYGQRISRNQAHLNGLQKQKRDAITQFKEATKYNSTQQLLEKYGAEPKPSESPSEKVDSTKTPQAPQPQQQQRTNLPPPPTANIQRPGRVAQHAPIPPSQPQQPQPAPVSPQSPTTPSTAPSRRDSTAEFAPNAEAIPAQYAAPSVSGPTWYDRLMDVVLGEDETKSINRVALICAHCKLVNGQAPPGIKNLEEVGRWRCMGCRAWNGEESELKKIVEEGQEEAKVVAGEKVKTEEDEVKEERARVEDLAEAVEDASPAKSTRSKTKDTAENA